MCVQPALHTVWLKVRFSCFHGHKIRHGHFTTFSFPRAALKVWSSCSLFFALSLSFNRHFLRTHLIVCQASFQWSLVLYLWENMILSYVLYFLCPASIPGDPQICDWKLLCSSLEASQMGSCNCHTPIPVSEGEGPARTKVASSSSSSGREEYPEPSFCSLLLPCVADHLPFCAPFGGCLKEAQCFLTTPLLALLLNALNKLRVF